MQTQEYKDFSLRVHSKGLRRPIVGQFELTYRCNLSCRYCYVVNDLKKKELALREWCRIFDEVYQEGCLWFCFTGGEPFLREDFLDIYSYAYKRGFIITIFSNATLLNEETAKYLKRFPPFCIEVTLNAVVKKTYELITQIQDSFEKAIQGIELMRKYNLPLKLKCQAMTVNIDEFHLLRKFYKKMGMRFIYDVTIEPRIDGSKEPCSFRLPLEKILALSDRKEVSKEKDEIENIFLKEKYEQESKNVLAKPSDNLFRCPGGTWAFYVNPFGELFFCRAVRKPSWNLRYNSFRQGFYDLFPKIRSEKFKTNSECRSCSLWNSCFCCPGKAELEMGDKETPIPYYCKLAKVSSK